MKRYLAVYFYETMDPVFLYKDMGSITIALAKYHGWQTSFAYLDVCGEITDKSFQKYVNLVPIHYTKYKIIKWKNIIMFIWRNANNYDVLNFYFGGRQELLLGLIAKIKNPKIKIYIKMDLLKEKYLRQINISGKFSVKLFKALSNLLGWVVDLYTVECKKYILELNKIKRFTGKIKYLPNGFFSDLVEIDNNIQKEKIILTVGRLGAVQKNTEMLVEVIENIEPLKLQGWKVYLVGPMTNEFKQLLNKKIKEKPFLKDIFVVTGNIRDKKELFTLYARSSVFVLPSRWESWGLVVTEAMSFGCYPIVTDCCDAFKEIIHDDISGKIISNEDKESLKVTIEKILEKKIDYIKAGKISQSFIKETFDWKMIADKLCLYLK